MRHKGIGILDSIHKAAPPIKEQIGMTFGIVVSTNDPLQMGRLRVACPAYNDNTDINSETYNEEYIPWATYCSPFAGSVSGMARGPEKDRSEGVTSYGIWAIPKRGTKVLVTCVDGNPNIRVWMGCVYDLNRTNLLPGGRYIVDGDDNNGPLTESEQPIQPLYDNQTNAFKTRSGFEWQTRGADYQASSNTPVDIKSTQSEVADTFGDTILTEVSKDGSLKPRTMIQGYGFETAKGKETLLINQTFSWTSPGLHTIIQDDRPENCRMKLRTTTGHQIILDDTNERIFVSTHKGNSWIEMDSNGNVDVYADRYLNFHSKKTMNFTSDESIRMRAKNGIHFLSDTNISLHSGETFNLACSSFVLNSETIDMKASTDLILDATTSLTVNSASIGIGAGASVIGLTGASVLLTGSLGFNASPGPLATPSTAVIEYAYSTNRVPFKFDSTNTKTWSRGMLDSSQTDKDSSNLDVDYMSYSCFEFPYDSDKVGHIELGEDLPKRGTHWRR